MTARSGGTARPSPARTWVAGLVLLCMLAQALLAPAQRTNERLHFHLGSLAATLLDRPAASASFASLAFAHRRAAPGAAIHDEATPHHHAALQDHAHGALSGVVYVSDDGPSKGSHGSSKRSLLDQDGLGRHVMPRPLLAAARVGFIKSTLRLRTRSEPPLERPPRLQA